MFAAFFIILEVLILVCLNVGEVYAGECSCVMCRGLLRSVQLPPALNNNSS